MDYRRCRDASRVTIFRMSIADVVASMVVFTNGVADKANYRKFKQRNQTNDDFDHMRETMERRLSEKNIKEWGMPDLLLIDGGRGQLATASGVVEGKGLKIPMIGLAKKRRNSRTQRLVGNTPRPQSCFEILRF